MNAVCFMLVLFSAVLHSVWNLLAKKALDAKAFIWLTSFLVMIFYLPVVVAAVLIERPALGLLEGGVILGTTALHLVYFIALQTGYKVGDFSVVYPVARGTGPLLSSVGAILLLAERPSIPALFGVGLILLGVFIIGGGVKVLEARDARPIAYGLLTGFFIACYTIWDKVAVADIGISPILLDYSATCGIAAIMTPYVFAKKDLVEREWTDNRWAAIWVALLSPAAFMIVLFVLKTQPVSYVAPLREISILFAAFLGARVLSEGHVRRRALAATVMFVGVAALALF